MPLSDVHGNSLTIEHGINNRRDFKEFKEALEELLLKGNHIVVMNFVNTESLSSSVISLLLQQQTHYQIEYIINYDKHKFYEFLCSMGLDRVFMPTRQ